MPQIKKLTIDISYFETKVSPRNEPWELAERCREEILSIEEQISLISKQFSLLSKQLSKTVTKNKIKEITFFCLFHCENLLFRKYILRERAWDVLAALTGIKRKKTSDEKFRESVLTKAKADYRKLFEAFSSIWELISVDGGLRNTATHDTNLELHFKQNGNIVHFGLLLRELDHQNEDRISIIESVREALIVFVTQKEQHIEKLSNAVIEFSRQCEIAIEKIN